MLTAWETVGTADKEPVYQRYKNDMLDSLGKTPRLKTLAVILLESLKTNLLLKKEDLTKPLSLDDVAESLDILVGLAKHFEIMQLTTEKNQST